MAGPGKGACAPRHPWCWRQSGRRSFPGCFQRAGPAHTVMWGRPAERADPLRPHLPRSGVCRAVMRTVTCLFALVPADCPSPAGAAAAAAMTAPVASPASSNGRPPATPRLSCLGPMALLATATARRATTPAPPHPEAPDASGTLGYVTRLDAGPRPGYYSSSPSLSSSSSPPVMASSKAKWVVSKLSTTAARARHDFPAGR